VAPKSHKNLPFMALVIVLSTMAAWPDIAVARPSGQAAVPIKSLQKKAIQSQGAIRFWQDRERGRWKLHLRHEKCWDIHGKQLRKVCRHARQMYKYHKVRLAKLEAKIERLSEPRDTGFLPLGQARDLGRRMAAEYGWVGEQWQCLDALWGRYESSWYVYSDNPTSTAYGIPQAAPGSKMGPGWRNSAYVQIKWGLGYISKRYSTPCSALSVRLATGSY